MVKEEATDYEPIEHFTNTSIKTLKKKLTEAHSWRTFENEKGEEVPLFSFERKGLGSKLLIKNNQDDTEEIISLDKSARRGNFGDKGIYKNDISTEYKKYLKFINPEKAEINFKRQLNASVKRNKKDNESNEDFYKRITPQKTTKNFYQTDALGNVVGEVPYNVTTMLLK